MCAWLYLWCKQIIHTHSYRNWLCFLENLMHIHFLFVAANIQLLCLHWENLKWRKWSTAGKRLFRTWHSVLAVGCGFILSLSTQSPCGVSCSEYEFIDILNIMATASHFRFLQAVEVIVMWIVIYIFHIWNSYMK